MKPGRTFRSATFLGVHRGLVILIFANAAFATPAQEFGTLLEFTDYWKCNRAEFGLSSSSVASLTVVPDTDGPRPLSAVVLSTGASNLIHVLFNESLFNGVENRATNNYRIVVAGNTNQFVAVTNVQLAGSSVILRVGPDYWEIGGGYYLILNNVTDVHGNVIAPNTRIAIGWPRSAILVRATSEWRYHAIAQFDSLVYDANWTGTNYLESILWGRDSAPFCAGPVFGDACLGECGWQVQFSYQPEPTLFRTTFVWPTNWPITGQLRVRLAFDDGFALYLNGREMARSNVASSVTRMTAGTRATANAPILCNTNLLLTVTNLFPGTNWLAVATVDSGSDGVTVLALEMQGEALVAPALPAEPAPRLQFDPLDDGRLRLWWDGFGYTLESVSNLTDNFASAPLGPWQQVPRLTNPYTNTLIDPSRFFRLRK